VFLECIRNVDEQQQSIIKQPSMTEFETMEELHQNTSTPYEQGVVKIFTVFCEARQTDLNIDTNKLLMNTVPESLEKTSSSQLQISIDSKIDPLEDRKPLKIEIYANNDSHFSFRIVDPLAIVWEKHDSCFVLKSPLSVKMEDC